MRLYTRVHQNETIHTATQGNNYATVGNMNIHSGDKINKFVIICGSTDILLYERLHKGLYTEYTAPHYNRLHYRLYTRVYLYVRIKIPS